MRRVVAALLQACSAAVRHETLCLLSRTLAQLASRRQSAKLLLYRRFSHVLLAAVVVSALWVCWQMAVIVSDSLDERWDKLWVFDAFWHVLYLAVLLAICYLWSPSQNNLQYAYMDELGQADQISIGAAAWERVRTADRILPASGAAPLDRECQLLGAVQCAE